MSVGTFISGALTLLEMKKYDVALSLVSSAVDATARKMFPDMNNNARFKEFIKKYMYIISYRGFPGIIAGGIKIKCRNIDGLRTDGNVMVGIEEIIYTVIRCGLIHECEIDSRIEFTEKTYIGDFDRKFKIPKDLVYGLILAVILSEHNREEKADDKIIIQVHGEQIEVNDLWGTFNEFQKRLR